MCGLRSSEEVSDEAELASGHVRARNEFWEEA